MSNPDLDTFLRRIPITDKPRTVYHEEPKVKSRNEKLKIVIIGSRGIPCTYGGFETFAERLAVELVEQGHSVTVYGQYDEGKKKGGITI